MIDFKPITLDTKKQYMPYLFDGKEKGCGYSFTNLYLWGRQCAAVSHGHLAIFSHFNQRSVYPYPAGTGDKRLILDAIISDAKERGISCRITGLTPEDRQTLQELYPERFCFHCDRNNFDYVYAIDDLADLPGKNYQKKRNHCNRFQKDYPNYTLEPLSEKNLSAVQQMAKNWYEDRLNENPDGDYLMEQVALSKAFRHRHELELEGLVLLADNEILAFTLGSRLSSDTFDIHFEKAKGNINGAYAVINQEFARYIREAHPDIRFLNREEDMGIEGLRIAKQRYFPHHMVEKYWAHLKEDGYEY